MLRIQTTQHPQFVVLYIIQNQRQRNIKANIPTFRTPSLYDWTLTFTDYSFI